MENLEVEKGRKDEGLALRRVCGVTPRRTRGNAIVEQGVGHSYPAVKKSDEPLRG